MTGEWLYTWVLASADFTDALRALNDKCLCRLSAYLELEAYEEGTRGDVMGLCLLEQAERFGKQVTAREGKQ